MKTIDIAAVVTGVVVVIGALYAADKIYAKASELRRVEGILQYHLIDVRFTSIRDRLWKLKANYGEDCIKIRKDCKDALNNLEDIRVEMKRMIK